MRILKTCQKATEKDEKRHIREEKKVIKQYFLLHRHMINAYSFRKKNHEEFKYKMNACSSDHTPPYPMLSVILNLQSSNQELSFSHVV